LIGDGDFEAVDAGADDAEGGSIGVEGDAAGF
jgi:hypothetical protein